MHAPPPRVALGTYNKVLLFFGLSNLVWENVKSRLCMGVVVNGRSNPSFGHSRPSLETSP